MLTALHAVHLERRHTGGGHVNSLGIRPDRCAAGGQRGVERTEVGVLQAHRADPFLAVDDQPPDVPCLEAVRRQAVWGHEIPERPLGCRALHHHIGGGQDDLRALSMVVEPLDGGARRLLGRGDAPGKTGDVVQQHTHKDD